MQNTKVFIIAGEVSGDLHGANLIKEINTLSRNIEFIGWGGDRMEKEGMAILKHVRTLSFMGFLAVFLAAFAFRKTGDSSIFFRIK